MASVELDYSDEWVLADLEAEPHQWAHQTIRRRAHEEETELPEDQAGLLAEVLMVSLAAARKEEVPPLMVLFLMPEADEPAVCSVSVRAEMLTPDITLEDLLEEIRLPEEMLEQPAQQDELETASGPATHLVQRYRVPVNPEYELVQEHEMFVWRLSDGEGDFGVFLSTSYLDLVAAGRHRPNLVDLAKSLTVVP
ncbi:hypothetical protein [Kineosporia babensis]|uniref:Uncharacterized protein n=1 Tax=Kineosporia babensis TaxID=499548 RepID=A0A9X1NLZ2_9ACTN|nr:hypothetical protein [Kineosporia babensis]MCD5316229.1 hypothetical protein [Kineosporia babensis]